jgi:hypothetical protein
MVSLLVFFSSHSPLLYAFSSPPGVLVGVLFFTLTPPLRVLLAAARLVDELKPNDHVTAALKSLR